MKKNLFQEYMNSRGKVDKPVVSITGDRTDPMTPPNAPPKGGKPYKVSDGKKTKKAGEKGFGDLGDSDLKFTYDLKGKGKAPAKIPTCERVELASLVAKSCAKDPTLVEDLVSQIRKHGLMGALVVEMLSQKETFDHISEVMAHKEYGPELCAKLVRAMNEQTAPNFASQLDDEDNAKEDEPTEEDEDEGDGEGDEDEMMGDGPEDIDAGMEDPAGGMGMADPSMAAGGDMATDGGMGMMPPMDPSGGMGVMNQDPNAMMGMQGMPQGDPMMGMQGMQQPPPGMPPAMANFQRAMMKRYQMKQMNKR